MNRYSKHSRGQLDTCHIDLRLVFETALPMYDHKILEGHREEEGQDRAYREGFSKVRWPDGNHNAKPSTALDASPYPVLFPNPAAPEKDQRLRLFRFYHFAGFIAGVATQLGIALRWGGDWDSDHDFSDQTFNDLLHYELLKKG